MEKIFIWVLHHKKTIVLTFLVAVIVSAFCSQFVQVNYDMNDYLPEDSVSSIALDTMENEFDSDIPNARIMVPDLSIDEALDYKERFMEVEGVTDVIWLDDVVSLYQPISIQDQTIVDNYYKDGYALFTVTIDDNDLVETVSKLGELIGEEGAMTGAVINNATATEATLTEMPKIIMIAVPIVLLILILTTKSWIEPLIVLVSIGIAILLNSGSNLIFGEVSFVTNGAGNILQLAVSLDYSVFLLHKFEDKRKEGLDAEKAMLASLTGSVTSILSSGLTTVIGFAALILMRFGIGPDLGMALAKGIFLSLLTVFTLLPVLTLYTYKWMEKTQHKPLLPSFNRFGVFVSRQMIPMVIIFTLLVVPSFLAQQSNNFYYGSEHIFASETKLGQDNAYIDQVFGKSNPMVLLVPKGDVATETIMSEEIGTLAQVNEVISYVDNIGAEIPTSFIPEDLLSDIESENYRRIIINVSTQFEGDAAFSTVETIRAIAQKYYPDSWYLAGESASTYDLRETITADSLTVNIIAIAAVFIILMLSFKSIAIPFVLVLSIETAIWINLSVPYYEGSTLFYLSYLIIGSIQLGATVDYAILTTSRYLELRETMLKKEAIQKTISGVTVSVLTSGLSMTVVGFLLGIITSHGVLKQLGILLGRGTILSMVIVFFVLPGLLYLFDGLIEATTKNCNFRAKEKNQKKHVADQKEPVLATERI